VLLFVVLLLRPYDLGFSIKAGAAYRSLWDQRIVEQPMVDLALAEAFEERREENAPAVARLVLFLALALGSFVAEHGVVAMGQLQDATAAASLSKANEKLSGC
jgi:hypothetical protein